MYILSKIKRFFAMSLAVIITLGALGLAENEETVTTQAVEQPSSYEQELNKLEKEQEELQNQIDQADNDIQNRQNMLNNVVKQLDVISKKIETSEKYSKEIEKEICTIDEQMRETQYTLSNQEDAIRKNVNDFMQRVRSMYLAGSDSYTEILVNSSDFYDVLMRIELVKRVAEHDNKTIDGLIKQKEEIDATKTALEKQKESLSSKSKKYADEQKKLSDEYEKLSSLQNEYGSSIAALQNDKDELQKRVDSLVQEYQAKLTTTTAAAVTSKTTGSKAATTKKGTNSANVTQKTTTKKVASSTKATTSAPKNTTKKTTTKAPQVKPTPPSDDYDTKINILMATAKSMVGGAYVWGGSSPNATDCSGLTMQCYAKIGINLPHLASAQANYGTSVSYSNMKKGDLIFFGGSTYSSIYHVAIYIGDGMMIHAENSNTGIVISYVDSFAKYNHITCIKRLI